MENKTIGMAIGATIVVILMATFLVPICQDVTDMSVAKYNNSAGHYAMASADDTVILDYSNNGGSPVWTVNGIEVSSPATELLFITNDKALMAGASSATFMGSGFGRQDNVQTMHLVIGDNHAEGTLTTSTRSFTPSFDYDWCLYVSPTGNYRSISASSEPMEVYVKSVDDLYYANWNYTLGTWFSGAGESVTLGNDKPATVSADLVPVDGVDGIYTVLVGNGSDSFGFTSDNSGTPYTTYPYYYIVPASVTGEKMAGGFATAGIIQMIPVIVLVALLATVIGGIVVSRNN